MSYEEIIAREFNDLPCGMRGKIVYDSHPQPYDGDTVGQIAYISDRYTLGTEHVSRDRMDEIRDGIANGELIGLPIYAYVHGGATIKAGSGFSCPWDSGLSGYVYVDRETALKEFKDEEAVLRCLRIEVGIFDAYLTGSVYGWVLEDEDGNELESCWGYYGDDEFEYMESEIRSSAAYHERRLAEEQRVAAEAAAAEAAEAAHWAACDVVTI